ncbi:UNKNOWN [Stylonychia lemnae]|uniref:Uncharacterized protein n=1 Tax=Stylonychia lemnae TaxID=5949 RepID=A0A078B3I2_STYLE|nr:UNKNOWN [Stylonychia lemnae]|eukprot:CDW89090.1 UNKNOWN [Stylonychia lemnae]
MKPQPQIKFNAMSVYNNKKSRFLFTLLNSSQKDCIVCQNGSLQSLQHPVITATLSKKYMTSREYYDAKIVNDIIYNEPTRLVSIFKDYLIYDDVSEFLKRSYTFAEAKVRLPKIYEFYEKYSKVFPNYVILPENKYMFKNIERKQRLIDDKQKIIMDKQQKSKEKKKSNINNQLVKKNDSFKKNQLFNTKFIESVLNNHNPSVMDVLDPNDLQNSRSLINEYKNLTKNQAFQNKPLHVKNIGEVQLDRLVQQFISKDSEIQNTMLNESFITVNFSHFQKEIELNNQNQANLQDINLDQILAQTSQDQEKKQQQQTKTNQQLVQQKHIINNQNHQLTLQAKLNQKYRMMNAKTTQELINKIQKSKEQVQTKSPHSINKKIDSDNPLIVKTQEIIQTYGQQKTFERAPSKQDILTQGLMTNRIIDKQPFDYIGIVTNMNQQQKNKNVENVPVYSNIVGQQQKPANNLIGSDNRLFSPVYASQNTAKTNEVTTPRSFLKQKISLIQDQKLIQSQAPQSHRVHQSEGLTSNIQLIGSSSHRGLPQNNLGLNTLGENIFNLKQAQSTREMNKNTKQAHQNAVKTTNKRSSSTNQHYPQQIQSSQSQQQLILPYAQQQQATFLKQNILNREKSQSNVNELIDQQRLLNQQLYYASNFKSSANENIYSNTNANTLTQPLIFQQSGNFTSRVAAQGGNQKIQQFNYQQFYPEYNPDNNAGKKKYEGKSSDRQQQYYSGRNENLGSLSNNLNQLLSPSQKSLTQSKQLLAQQQQAAQQINSARGIPIHIQKNIIIKKQK